jgi:hypothetical protein
VVTEKDLEPLRELLRRLGEPDGYDDEESGYRLGVQDAVRVLTGHLPQYRGQQ